MSCNIDQVAINTSDTGERPQSPTYKVTLPQFCEILKQVIHEAQAMEKYYQMQNWLGNYVHKVVISISLSEYRNVPSRNA